MLRCACEYQCYAAPQAPAPLAGALAADHFEPFGSKLEGSRKTEHARNRKQRCMQADGHTCDPCAPYLCAKPQYLRQDAWLRFAKPAFARARPGRGGL